MAYPFHDINDEILSQTNAFYTQRHETSWSERFVLQAAHLPVPWHAAWCKYFPSAVDPRYHARFVNPCNDHGSHDSVQYRVENSSNPLSEWASILDTIQDICVGKRRATLNSLSFSFSSVAMLLGLSTTARPVTPNCWTKSNRLTFSDSTDRICHVFARSYAKHDRP